VLTDDKLTQHDISYHLGAHDVICITETGQCDSNLLGRHFPNHTPHILPSPTSGLAGHGIAVLVKNSYAPHTRKVQAADDADTACLWVKVGKAATHLDKDLLIGTCYVPPEGSSQLRGAGASLEDRFMRLLQYCTTLGSGHVFCAGDFNARIAGLPDGAAVQPQQRLFSDASVNRAGRLFVSTCRDAGLAVLTGRAPGDKRAVPTYHHPLGTSRPDHVAVSYSMYGMIRSHRVMRHLLGSDHLPLVTTISLPAPPPPASPPPTTPLPVKLAAQPQLQPSLYASASSDATAADMQHALNRLPDVDAAYADMVVALHHHAVRGGAKPQQGTVPITSTSPGLMLLAGRRVRGSDTLRRLPVGSTPHRWPSCNMRSSACAAARSVHTRRQLGGGWHSMPNATPTAFGKPCACPARPVPALLTCTSAGHTLCMCSTPHHPSQLHMSHWQHPSPHPQPTLSPPTMANPTPPHQAPLPPTPPPCSNGSSSTAPAHPS